MTVKEATISFCAIEVPENTVDLEIINSGLDGELNYTGPLAKQVARIACNVLSAMLSLSNFKEGDLSITLDREGIKARLLFLAKQYGFDDIISEHKPVIRDKSHLW